MRNEKLATFLFKVSDGGIDDALENYSNDLRDLSPKVDAKFRQFANAKENLIEVIYNLVLSAKEKGEITEEEAEDFLEIY